MRRLLLGSIALLCALGCAPRQAVTTWGYSHWYVEGGGGEMGAFEDQQKQCLDRLGIEGDPASVAPDSPQENEFLECMNGSGWCTQAYGCDKPGA